MTGTEKPTLAHLLIKNACGAGGEREVILYQHGDGTRHGVTGVDMLERAQRAAAVLRAQGVTPGERVLLMLNAQADFVDAFFGAIWADAVPVPLFPPTFSRCLEDFIANFQKISRNSGARALVVSKELIGVAQGFAGRLGTELNVLSPTSWNGETEKLEEWPIRGSDDIAFLQYTSGSTGTPKGVALSHANVLANVRAIGRAVNLNDRDVGVSWLPLYHDMGLIGVLCTLYWGGKVVSLSPLAFAKNPISWLRAISEHGGTLSPAPNFAFRRCLRVSEADIKGLDLSTWRVAFNGAEPVKSDTLQNFAARFARCGFRASALYPVYGLAEHTLAVSFPALGQGPHIDTVNRDPLAMSGIAESVLTDHPDAVSFVSVGAPLEGVTVEIRDRRGVVLPEGHVGEVLVKSASVMTGYFRNAGATAKVLLDGWLNTGDLGYFKNGMLYITGRAKDLIIHCGRNYYPQDLESAADQVTGVRPGRVVAFSVPSENDDAQVVVLAETEMSEKTQLSELSQRVSAAVAARVGIRPHRVVLHGRGALPITSSGKVRRTVARSRFIEGKL